MTKLVHEKLRSRPAFGWFRVVDLGKGVKVAFKLFPTFV